MMMAGPYAGTLSDLPTVRDEVTCSINAENPTGAKGFGCRETGPLGPSRKGKPCFFLSVQAAQPLKTEYSQWQPALEAAAP